MDEFNTQNERMWTRIISDMVVERERKGISQAALSHMTGIKQSAISRMESLRVPPQIDTLVKVLAALGLQLSVQDMTRIKEDLTMKAGHGHITEVRAELLFTRITVSVSNDDAFHLVTGEEKEFSFQEADGGVLILAQKKRKLIQKFFDWIPVKAELRLPASFHGRLTLFNRDGATVLQGLKLSGVDVKSHNGRLILTDITAETINGDSDNGRAELQNVTAGDVRISSDNGRISLADINAKTLKAESDNGKVTGKHIDTDAVEIKSDNGKIVLDGLKSDSISLWSKNGRIAAFIEGNQDDYSMEIEVLNGNTFISGKKFRGCYIYKDKDKRKHIAAYSKNGSTVLLFSDSAPNGISALTDEIDVDDV